MPGESETAVETPAVNNESVVPASDKEAELKKEEAVVADEAGSGKGEKKDEEKEETKEEKSNSKTPAEKVPPPPSVHKKDFENDVVYLYQSARCPTSPSLSPYCLLTETWIKYNNIKYENMDHKNRLRSKKGLLPFIELNGEEIADSDVILSTLSAKFEKDMDASLTPEQRNIKHAMVSMINNHTLWCILQWRTRNADNMTKGYKLNLQTFTNYRVPNGLRPFAFKHIFLRKITRKVKAVGLGGKSDEEVDNLGKHDLKVLSDLLGDKQFFFGDEPSSLDLTAFVQLALLINVVKEVACPMRDYLDSDCTNLIGLYNRFKDRAWGDHWDEAIGDKLDMNPHIPKPEPPVEEEKKEEKKEEEKEKADEKKEEKEKDDKEENKESKTDENKESEEKK